MNGLGPDRVEARHAAVGASAGRQMLVAFEDEPYRNHLARNGTSGQSINVLTFDAVCTELGRVPEWMRMDVQGLEFDVLSGAREAIESGRRSIKIVVETHPDQWADSGINAAEAHDRFCRPRAARSSADTCGAALHPGRTRDPRADALRYLLRRCGPESPQQIASRRLLVHGRAACADRVGNHHRRLSALVPEIEVGALLGEDLDDRVVLGLRRAVQRRVSRLVDGVDLAAQIE